ncbi:MAG: exsH [Sphingomonas bacterium]|nr:exsH [Sphingomonas bacterium]
MRHRHAFRRSALSSGGLLLLLLAACDREGGQAGLAREEEAVAAPSAAMLTEAMASSMDAPLARQQPGIGALRRRNQRSGTNPHPIIDGHRTLQAEKVPTRDGNTLFDHSAPMVSPLGWYAFQYGYVELRARVGPESGRRPGILAPPGQRRLATRDRHIRILKRARWSPRSTGGTIRAGGRGSHRTDFYSDGERHGFGLDWTPEWLVPFVDGQEVHRTRNISHEPMYILINTAVGLLSTGPPQARGPRPAGRTT